MMTQYKQDVLCCCEIYQECTTSPYHHIMLYSRGVCVFARHLTQSNSAKHTHNTAAALHACAHGNRLRVDDSMPSPNNNTTVQTLFVFAYYLSTPLPNPPRFYRPYLVISKLFV